ncbi:hydrolase [Kineosporia sp. NBRC 101677]|uniref:alpha/beta fold hydrolase n=1 Tax=Kineosporia sp. NBRC 101677 TaxID=3032197 RepID=UPI0024A0E8AF|nr:alpha/beta hydrolase [Kineosporia sp. NBRC 101677]GLY16342.1 hydrolase [Kineosporia sp. NBRC 101677]
MPDNTTDSTAGLLAPGAHEIDIDGVRQSYHVAGRGPVCVAHPGGPGLNWSYLRSAELEEHFTVVYVEPVGTGRSGRPSRYGLSTYVHFLSVLIERLDQAVYLLGHSHGGFVAQAYALTQPQLLAGLILYSTSPQAGPGFWSEGMRSLASYPQRHPDVPEAAIVPQAFQQAVNAPDDDSMSQAFATAIPVYFADFHSRKLEFASFRESIRMSREAASAADPVVFDVTERLGEIVVPTVVLVGGQDFLCGPRWGSLLVQGLPDAQLHLLPDSGHFAHVEQPDAFAAAATSVIQLASSRLG